MYGARNMVVRYLSGRRNGECVRERTEKFGPKFAYRFRVDDFKAIMSYYQAGTLKGPLQARDSMGFLFTLSLSLSLSIAATSAIR